MVITGQPTGPVLFCMLTSVGVVCNAADHTGSRARRWLAQPTLHGGPV